MDLAKDMLSMLTNNLPEDITTINQLYAEQNYSALLLRVHKLHGAVSYCGAPRLKSVLSHIERQLKSQIMDNLPFLFNQLNTEVGDLLQKYHT